MKKNSNIKKYLQKTVLEKKNILGQILKENKKIYKIIDIIANSIKLGGKVLFCGNGGSASDSQHLATEFLVRLRPKVNRSAIPALSLTLDNTYLTACANDFGYEKVFSRSLESFGKSRDILIVISTSGNSKNIIEVLRKAKKMKIFSIGFLGSSGGKAKELCNIPIIIKSKKVARIQEAHIFLGHIILEGVENILLASKFIRRIK